MSNYRSIFNLSFLSKILEKIVLRQLLAHIDTHNLLSVYQSAYREGHGKETALSSIVNNILRALDEDTIFVLLFLDLSAAFDTICHEILLSRLDTFFGIHSAALSWFRSYLSERKQFVVIQDNRSSTAPLDFGAPHVLFILHIALLSLTTEKQS